MSIQTSAETKKYKVLKLNYEKNIKNLPDDTVFYRNRLCILLDITPYTLMRYISKKYFPNAYLSHGRVSTKPMWHIPIGDVHKYMSILKIENSFPEQGN